MPLATLAITATKSAMLGSGEITAAKSVTAVKAQLVTMLLVSVSVALVTLVLDVKWNAHQVFMLFFNFFFHGNWLKNKLGTWGYGCSEVCQCNWSNSESCDPVNGQCMCKNGFTGDGCTEGIFLVSRRIPKT